MQLSIHINLICHIRFCRNHPTHKTGIRNTGVLLLPATLLHINMPCTHVTHVQPSYTCHVLNQMQNDKYYSKCSIIIYQLKNAFIDSSPLTSFLKKITEIHRVPYWIGIGFTTKFVLIISI
jgi:hypothetical protein